MERNKKQKIVPKDYNIIRNSEQGVPKNNLGTAMVLEVFLDPSESSPWIGRAHGYVVSFPGVNCKGAYQCPGPDVLHDYFGLL